MPHAIPVPPIIPRAALAEAVDEASILGDLVWLLFLAGEGLSGQNGGAIARGALLATERIHALQHALRQVEEAVDAATDNGGSR